ncbi:nucleoplasmin-like protein ANO39 [Anastrepha obliqua]|uniref:nucleoplasmin-like protein ANO39 n=1 Tax=Anastrepha obliqua TaxID=95512 RepID=UPI00240A3269|nr:nucleoplasmin-like protein ANO39 [Anastrepha obliqua]
MRPTKICEEEIEKILAMSDEDEEDFSISESEFETNLLEEGMNSSEDDSSDNSEDWNEEPPPQAPQDNIIPFSKRFLRGKNKYKWATTKGKLRRYAINIVHHDKGPTGAAKNVTDCAEVFKSFITNIEIEKKEWRFSN